MFTTIPRRRGTEIRLDVKVKSVCTEPRFRRSRASKRSSLAVRKNGLRTFTFDIRPIRRTPFRQTFPRVANIAAVTFQGFERERAQEIPRRIVIPLTFSIQRVNSVPASGRTDDRDCARDYQIQSIKRDSTTRLPDRFSRKDPS